MNPALIILLAVIEAWVFGIIGYAWGRATAPEIDRTPQPCKHPHVSHTTTIHGMEELRALFSGRITVEQYRDSPDVGLVTHTTVCSDCGKEWNR